MNTRKNRKLKGSVLFTVVSVMSLLIIFLTGTLVLAASANKRAHRSYSTSQAEYTARAAIESFTAAMQHNPDVAGAMQNLTTTLYPTVQLDSAGMGHIGCYDDAGNYCESKIKIEPLDESYDRFYYTGSGWEKLSTIRISATATVGKEEKTVTAYIRKKAPNEISPSNIKGLQTAGASIFNTTEGKYTGAVVLGITDIVKQTYEIKNGSVFDTDLAFINGNLDVVGSGLNINANYMETGTVIMGDLAMENTSLVNVTYTPNSEFTQKNIPYLYVDGQIKPKASATTKLVDGNKAPFNIFAGSINCENAQLDVNADLYLMDDVDNSGNKVMSYLGGNTDKKLYKWIYSTVNKTSTQFESFGGSLYSKGSVSLKQGTIDGDVRVEGDVILDGGVTIKGNLVCGGNIAFNGSPNITGNIYALTISGNETTVGGVAPKPGYAPVNPPVIDRYVRVKNATIQHEYWTETNKECWVSEDLLADSTIGATIDPNDNKYDCHGKVIKDENDPGIPDYYYADIAGDENDLYEKEVNRNLYVAPGGGIVEEAEAVVMSDMKWKGREIKPVADFISANGTVYPKAMTREAVTGKSDAGKYKIVRTIEEIQEELGYTPNASDPSQPGDFDENIYISDPAKINGVSNFVDWKDAANGRKNISDATFGDAYEITKSCIISGEIDKTVILKPTGQMWVILDGDNGKNTYLKTGKYIIVDDTHGSVNFFIKGKFKLCNESAGQTMICTKAMYERLAVNNIKSIKETDTVGITIYGSKDSNIEYQNNCVIFATAKAPYLMISGQTTSGHTITNGVTYEDEQGKTQTFPNPAHWVGSALIKGIDKGFNNFNILYCKSGGDSGSDEMLTAAGTYIFSYYDQY